MYTFHITKPNKIRKNILQTIIKIQNISKIWRIWSFTLKGKIIVLNPCYSKNSWSFNDGSNWKNSWVWKNTETIIVPTKPKIKTETISSDFKD